MSGRPILGGSTDVSTVIRIVDSTDGTPEQAVEHNTSGISLWYRREGGTVTAITPAALASADAAHSDGGIEHLDDGYYRLDLPDAAVAGSVAGVMVGGTVTGMIVIGVYHPIVAYNPSDGVRLGLTALPNAAADAAGGLPVSDAGGLDLDARLDAAVSSRSSHSAADVWSVATRVLTANTNLNDPTAAAIAAAVLDELLSGHTTAGSLGKAISDILTDTGTTLDGKIDVIKAVTDNLPDAGALSSLAQAADLATVDTVVDAIKVVTDQLVAAQSEPTGVPAANETPLVKLAVLFMALRNKVTVTESKKTFHDDAGNAEFEKDLSDDGATYEESEVNAP